MPNQGSAETAMPSATSYELTDSACIARIHAPGFHVHVYLKENEVAQSLVVEDPYLAAEIGTPRRLQLPAGPAPTEGPRHTQLVGACVQALQKVYEVMSRQPISPRAVPASANENPTKASVTPIAAEKNPPIEAYDESLPSAPPTKSGEKVTDASSTAPSRRTKVVSSHEGFVRKLGRTNRTLKNKEIVDFLLLLGVPKFGGDELEHHWGVDLERACKRAEIQPGDYVLLQYYGRSKNPQDHGKKLYSVRKSQPRKGFFGRRQK